MGRGDGGGGGKGGRGNRYCDEEEGEKLQKKWVKTGGKACLVSVAGCCTPTRASEPAGKQMSSKVVDPDLSNAPTAVDEEKRGLKFAASTCRLPDKGSKFNPTIPTSPTGSWKVPRSLLQRLDGASLCTTRSFYRRRSTKRFQRHVFGRGTVALVNECFSCLPSPDHAMRCHAMPCQFDSIIHPSINPFIH